VLWARSLSSRCDLSTSFLCHYLLTIPPHFSQSKTFTTQPIACTSPTPRHTNHESVLIQGPGLSSSSTSRDTYFAAFDWSPDKEGLCVMGSYDQSVRVCVVTKLNKL
jgi:hypothetical protein